MIGDSSDAVWGVMDIYPRTNFPDIRKKVILQTTSGNLLIIPREGGSLVRFYIELSHGTTAKSVQLTDLQEKARNIFHPYVMEFADTYWWSAYSIGQRTADFFHKSHRVFLTGDACHTHSPKAGQGMNTSLQDGYNIGWKLAAVIKGHAAPSLLKTYVLEREKVAHDLINFDREMMAIWSSSKKGSEEKSKDALVEHFLKSARYTAGLTARYDESPITWHQKSDQSMAKNLLIGMRVPSTQVVRFCDAKAMQFVQALPADGRWRVVIFAGDIADAENAERLKTVGEYLIQRNYANPTQIAQYLDSNHGPVRRLTRSDSDIDSFIEPIVVLSGARANVEQEQIPEYFWPITGQWKMRGMIFNTCVTFADDL